MILISKDARAEPRQDKKPNVLWRKLERWTFLKSASHALQYQRRVDLSLQIYFKTVY